MLACNILQGCRYSEVQKPSVSHMYTFTWVNHPGILTAAQVYLATILVYFHFSNLSKRMTLSAVD